jgi:CTP:molybdopterin cytidylyltransferase MocA
VGAIIAQHAFKECWCFDLTKEGLANSRKSAVYREVHNEPRVTVVVYHDQPTFTLDTLRPTGQETSADVTTAPSLKVQQYIIAARETSPVVLGAEDRQHRQLQVMKGWQKTARRKFEAFWRQHENIDRTEALALFELTFPTEANLCRQHLCRRCGSFAGAKDFICTQCKREAA